MTDGSLARSTVVPPLSSGADYQPRATAGGPSAVSDGRVPALDGVRAAAILIVLVHNAGSVQGPLDGVLLRLWALVSNAGWTGVQLFFALSGFLITRILLEGKGATGWMRNFYVRRVFRIMPLYYVMLAIVFLIAPHFSSLSILADRGARSQAWYWTYQSNWLAAFGGLATVLPHVWSLAVEEQFYLVWPFVVAVCTERRLAYVCVFLCLLPFVARIFVHATWPPDLADEAAYTFTVTRCDAIALGGLVALAVRHARARALVRKWFPLVFSATVIALLVAGVVGRGWPSKGPLSEHLDEPLSGLLSALIVLACVDDLADGGRVRRIRDRAVWLLSRGWLRTIGKYSYAIYVFHTPVHHMFLPHVTAGLMAGSGTRRFVAHVGYSLLVLAVSYVLALISWRLIEQPFLSLKRYFPMPASGSASVESAPAEPAPAA